MSLLKTTAGILLFCGLTVSLQAQLTIYADGLTNPTNTGSASGNVTGSGASSQINLNTARNQNVNWEFTPLTLADNGDFVSVTMTVVFSANIDTSNALFTLRVGDDTTNGYYDAVAFDMVGGGNEGQFSTSEDTNEGRFDILKPGTTARTFTFTSTKNASTNGLNIAASGNPFIDETGNSVNTDVTFAPTSSTYDMITFRFSGGDSGADWNTPLTATVTDFSITSNVPEPSTYAVFAGVAAIMFCLLRKRR